MEQDKDLKILLKEYAFEETSSTFNNSVMQRIEAAVSAKQSKPLLNAFILKTLTATFIIVALTVIICLVYLPSNNLPFNLSFALNNSIYNQLFSFIIVFWIMMLINIWWNKRHSSFENILLL